MSVLDVEYKIRKIIEKVDWLVEHCAETFMAYQEHDNNFQVDDVNSLLYEGYIDKLEDLFETGDYGLSLKFDEGIYHRKIEYEHTERNTITINLYECEDDSCSVIDSLYPFQDLCRITDEDRLKYLGLFEQKLEEIKTYYEDNKYPQYKLSDFCS